MNYRSYDDLSKTLIRNISLIPADIDLIVGIPRSGLLVGNMIALLLNKPITDLNGYIEDRLISCGHTKNTKKIITNCCQAKKVLIIDDSVATGDSISEAKDVINKFRKDGTSYIFACVYICPGKEQIVDLYMEVVSAPRMFEWNIFHHPELKNACFDIDGVLCEDPTVEQNDDGIKYIDFVRNATPKILPTQRIGAIVTSRLSKYDSLTREWMQKNGIEYDELVMMNCSAEERRKKGNHGEFKGKFYKHSKYELFVESELSQAITICKISHKPVYCVENGIMYDGTALYKLINEDNRIKQFLKKFLIFRKLNELRKALIYNAFRN